jgi:hypothetical protein
MLNLNELLTLMRGGVYTPQETLGVYDAQEQARRERRQTRKADLAEMLSSLQTTAYESATEGTSLDALLANPAVSQAAGALGEDALTSVLSPYYRKSGVSRLNPTLRPDQAADITRLLSEQMVPGTPFDPSAFFNEVMSDPEIPKAAAPQVSKLISDTLNQLKTRY